MLLLGIKLAFYITFLSQYVSVSQFQKIKVPSRLNYLVSDVKLPCCLYMNFDYDLKQPWCINLQSAVTLNSHFAAFSSIY